MEQKICRNCKVPQSTEKFFKDSSQKDGYYPWCKMCRKEQYRRKNPEVKRHPKLIMTKCEYDRLWRKRNKAQINERSLRRKYKLQSTTSNEVIDYYAVLYNDPCSYCYSVSTSIDHIVPISKNGAHSWVNLTSACQHCNSSKQTRSLLAFLLEVNPNGL